MNEANNSNLRNKNIQFYFEYLDNLTFSTKTCKPRFFGGIKFSPNNFSKKRLERRFG